MFVVHCGFIHFVVFSVMSGVVYPEDGGSTFHRNVSAHVPGFTVSLYL
jgi:hypothetical protein